MEDNRYVDRFYSVFDIPRHAGLDNATPGGKGKSTRVIMFYDRAENKRTFQVLNAQLSDAARRRIECWLAANPQICDAISGLKPSGV